MRWSITCSNHSRSPNTLRQIKMLIVHHRFEDVVRESHGELSMLSGGERNGYDSFPRSW